MLSFLRVRNLATIAELSVELRPGLNIFSGETGAGKSVLVRALHLVVGGRALSEYVRTGEEESEVEALFRLEPATKKRLSQVEGVERIGDELLLRRVIGRRRANRCYVDGRLVTQAVLSHVGRHLVEIVGQHQQQSLLSSDLHIDFLDGFAKLMGQRRTVARNHRVLVLAARALRSQENGERERLRRLDVLEHQIAELESLALEEGETERLEQRSGLLQSSEEIQAGCRAGFETLYDNEDCLISELSFLEQQLDRLSGADVRFGELVGRLVQVRVELEDISERLRDLGAEAEYDPDELVDLDERLTLIRRMRRKYGDTDAELLSYLASARAEREELQESALSKEDLARKLEGARAVYRSAAEKLSAQRRRAAAKLRGAVEAELAQLAMARTRFDVRIEAIPQERVRDGVGEQGLERIEFLISPNPGEDLKPLSKIASGGEISRVLLALKSLMSEVDEVSCLVFDEVDAGVGGGVARTVGEKLLRLSDKRQILCITHLPQIASLGERHVVVEKRVLGGRTLTRAKEVTGAGRERELARLLGGRVITDSTLQLARELLGTSPRVQNSVLPREEMDGA